MRRSRGLETETFAPPLFQPAPIDPDVPRSELYKRAKQLDIPGRSTMSKEELVRAIAEHVREGVAA